MENRGCRATEQSPETFPSPNFEPTEPRSGTPMHQLCLPPAGGGSRAPTGPFPGSHIVHYSARCLSIRGELLPESREVRRTKSRSGNTGDVCQVIRRQGEVADEVKICSYDERISTIVGSLGLLLIQVMGGSLFRTLKAKNGKNVAAEPSQAICGPEVQSLCLRNKVFEKTEVLSIIYFGVYHIASVSLLKLRIQLEMSWKKGQDATSLSHILSAQHQRVSLRR